MSQLLDPSAGRPVDSPTVDVSRTSFQMGSNSHYPEEAPARLVEVAAFRIERHAVTNRRFAAFIADTGHVTSAEQPLSPEELAALPESLRAPGALVFAMPEGPVPLNDHRRWWRFAVGACWRRPEGEGSDLAGREDHPVVQVSFEDACAYARWAGRSLPTEREWECAARHDDVGDPPDPARANTWQGSFPFHHARVSGSPFTLPVDALGPGPSGLHQMIGNTWEWTLGQDLRARRRAGSPCCTASGGETSDVQGVLKGGSFLCAASYCRRYRPQARSMHDLRSSTNHIGFRCVLRG